MTPGELGEVTLDFDQEGRLLGIEVLNAAAVLPPAVIASVTAVGE